MFKFAACLVYLAIALSIGCSRADTIDPTSSDPASAPINTAKDQPSPAALEEVETDETVVIPGERVGAVTGETTRQTLADLYEEDQLQDEPIPAGEGQIQPATRVDLGATRSFTVVWTDDTQTQIHSIRNFGTDWQLPEGIGVGTSFAELEKMLGAFEVYGFGWDYGGTIVLENTILEPYSESLFLRLRPSSEIELDSESYQDVMGDQRFPSSNPAFQSLDLSIEEMVVLLESPVQTAP